MLDLLLKIPDWLKADLLTLQKKAEGLLENTIGEEIK